MVELEGEGDERAFPQDGRRREGAPRCPENLLWRLPKPDSIEGLAV